jgi:Rod binding domain-containing protein
MGTTAARISTGTNHPPGHAGGTDKNDAALKQAFTDFVAGTFYQTMMKSLRKLHDKPAYLHGGQAEEFFQAQLDQTVAADLARQHGDRLAEPLWSAFQRR